MIARLKCPNCGKLILAPVVDSRPGNQVTVRIRRRECEHCGVILVTRETIQSFHEKRRRGP